MGKVHSEDGQNMGCWGTQEVRKTTRTISPGLNVALGYGGKAQNFLEEQLNRKDRWAGVRGTERHKASPQDSSL